MSGGEAYSQHHGGENEAGSKVHPNEGTENKCTGPLVGNVFWEGELKKGSNHDVFHHVLSVSHQLTGETAVHSSFFSKNRRRK